MIKIRLALNFPLVILFAIGGVALAYLERRSGRWLEAEARARMSHTCESAG